MALSKVNFNSLNVTPSASKFLAWDGDADALQASDVGGNLKLISTVTISSATAAASFTSGIDSTYKEYIFKWINVHASNDNVNWSVGFRDGSTNFDAPKVTTYFRAKHNEDGSGGELAYLTGRDEAGDTGDQVLNETIGNGGDESVSGTLFLFSPSSTTFVKHFIVNSNGYESDNDTAISFVAGYLNTTTAIDGLQFKFNSGNIDSGVIKMYGVL